ncbi:hypothetical protein [uncultured Algoriphagus sp.]|uniref:hypothetical protein n=1 Tax=uncultured Algoriphagus sp. TaxID=417365 RepID=UPI0030EC584C|tara:strand:+ start:73498 stop:74157 length:660 start_codon:yes stop_codon:yes gene_type:complete
MNKQLNLLVIIVFALFSSCEREIEDGQVDYGFDFQPLGVGLFWTYEVDQTIYYGENDSEQEQFFYRDSITGFYPNQEGDQVYIVERSRSSDKLSWEYEVEYTLIQRGQSLIRTFENQPVVALVFPPKNGVVWNGNAYRNVAQDDFEIVSSSTSIRVNQEDSDDLVTYRDIRYEVYDRNVGLVEKYEEVLTYCSRNDCLGDMLIDSGSKTFMKLTDYGKD